MASCIHWFFEEQADKRPNAIALTFEGSQTTYAALNRRSNRIAHALRQLGLQPGQGVGILLRDGPAPVAAMFGVLKAGGIVVCLDPCYPTGRVATILNEAKPQYLIAHDACLNEHDELAATVPSSFSAILLLDCDAETATARRFTERAEGTGYLRACADGNPERTAKPGDPAYIVYTSGSTGKPKGIVQSHRSFCQYIEWQSEQFNVRAPERFAQWASFAYDACYREVFCTLGFGATLCLATPAVRYNPKALIDWARRERISIFNVVPSFWRQVVEILKSEYQGGPDHPLPDLKVLLQPGEPMPADLAETWLNDFPNPPKLYNLYGPSECILATFHEVTTVAPDQRNIPIGQAIGGREILILDQDQQPCPVGADGEIYVRSQFLTMGYHGRPEETAEKFLQNPLHDDYPDPVYRTGDLGRFRSDGLLEFAGRRDRMVKIRGQRVELGEIEYALRRHASVRNCAVTVRSRGAKRESMVALERGAREGGRPGEQWLVVYYTIRDDVEESTLRDFLQERLPAHMVPQRFVRLDALPLNANHKLDVNALPEPDGIRPDLSEAYVAPRTDAEAAIAAIWQEVLGVDRVGVDDGFLDLGGNSLLAMQVLNRIRETVAVEVSFRDLFRRQTVAQLATMVEDAAQAGDDNDFGAGVSDPEDGLYPLSKAQEGIWFLWNLDPDNPYYTGQGSIRIKGELDQRALNRAWRALFERHEILRARFEQVGGQPRQRFLPAADVALAPCDLTHLTEAARDKIIEDAFAERARKAFNLETDALLDYRLYKVAADEHVIALSFHEIVVDLWGLSVLIGDLGDLYGCFARGDQTLPTASAFRFCDYVRWEQAAITPDKMQLESAYWRDQLSGELPVLSLPTDRSHPATPSYRGESKSVLLDEGVCRKLTAIARAHDATLFTTLLSAINMLLHVYSGQDDIIVGAPIANRQHPRSEDLVGFFLNMLPLRTRFTEDPSFAEVLTGMRETVTGALSHASYPFAWMLEQAEVVRDLSVQPVFQVMFNMLNLPQISRNNGGIQLSYDEFDTGHIKYDLAFYAQEQGDRVYFQIAYLTDLFDEETIQRMLENFVVLLDSVTDAPEAPLSTLRYLTDRERGLLLKDFNDTARPYPTDIPIHRLFECQAAATPEATALLFDGERLSYRGLNDRANRLARHLCRVGVASETRVAICMPRSFDMVVGLLAILKAGGAYVALDTEYPSQRLDDVIADSGAEYLLVGADGDRFDGFLGTTVNVDKEASMIASESCKDLAASRRPDGLLNIVYTSSTTGKPKGVLIEERSVLNRLHWMWEAYPFRVGDVALLQKSYALVASTWEIFGALLKGHPTVILRYEELLDPVRLWRRAVEHEVTHFLATPALLEGVLLQAKERPDEWLSLRLATTSAEQIPVSLVARWKQAFPDVPLLNLYGATECASNATVYDTSAMAADVERVPVGKPIGNIQVYVLDKHGNPLPLGATGEMCVAGACVARGYLNNAGLTRLQFVANPFAAESDAVLYRTGDLARLRLDGNLELAGRRDNRVTIRGFRVELNDIEAALSNHSAVTKAAVVAAGSGARKRLVAYVSTAAAATSGALRAHLTDRLPGYMVPAEFVLVDDIPFTPQGKLDRKALAAKAAQTATAAEAYVAPRTETEERLAAMWSRLLEVEKIGVHDDFFELGGQSLLAIQFFAELRREFATDLPLATLYRRPTIAAIAECLNGDGESSPWSSLVAIRSEGDKSPVFCVHGVYGDVLFYREFARNIDPDQPIYCLQPMTLSGKAMPYDGIEALAAHYVKMLRKVQPAGPYYICGYSFGGLAALEMAQQLRAEGETVAFLGIFDTIIGSKWADPVQHAEDLGQTRRLRNRSDGGVIGKARRALRESYPIWYAYMIAKGFWVELRGRLYDLYARRGHSLPRERRSDYTAWALRRIGKRYRPHAYKGDIVLFCSQKRRHKVIETWSDIADGELAISDVPGDHLFIFEPKNAKRVAAEFTHRIASRSYTLVAE